MTTSGRGLGPVERARRTVATLVLVVGVVAMTVLVQGSRPAAAMTPSSFITMAAAPAQAGQKDYGVPASVALAQAALESAWGESSLTKEGNAFFGIKCGSDKGPYANRCIRKVTRECTPTCHDEYAYFRGYATRADSFRDHGHLLRTSARYAPAFRYTSNPNEFIRQVAKAGYATDPDYATKIITMMRTYNLYAYDKPGTPAPPASSWTVLKSGSTGYRVTALQHLLRSHGAKIATDGAFGPATKKAVVAYQRSVRLSPDGVVGTKTWSTLTSSTVRTGSRGEAVRAAQSALRAKGYRISVDGVFGSGTRAATVAFQKKASLSADGIVGPRTWKALLR